jgi:hypothetical protein
MQRGIIKRWPNTSISEISEYSFSFQLIMGFGLPILVNDQSLTMGTVMKILYNVPINSSTYLDPLFNRDRRSVPKTSRWDIYSMLEVTCDRYISLTFYVQRYQLLFLAYIVSTVDEMVLWSIVE